MCKHEEKECPRCQVFFECRVGDILRCQCAGVQLSDAERDFISEQFADCLCMDCIIVLRKEYHFYKFQMLLNTFTNR